MNWQKKLAIESGTKARFICSDVLKLHADLIEEYDIVYASYGVLCWIPDLDNWFEVAGKYLKKGGRLLLIDGHPINNIFEYNSESNQLEIQYHYFEEETSEGISQTSYTDGNQLNDDKTNFQWSHTVSEIIMSGISVNLKLLNFKEYPYTIYQKYSNMIEREDGYWESKIYDTPYLYSLELEK